MKPAFQERHQDYVLVIATLGAGQILTGVPLVLDLDAPFVLRSRAALATLTLDTFVNAYSYYDLRFLKMTFTDPDENYVSQQRIPMTLQMPYAGAIGNPAPVYPELVYPAGGVIFVDVENTGSAAINNLRLYFRGVKLFPWGVRPFVTYPAHPARVSPYSYPLVFAGLGVSEKRANVPLIILRDGDFVLRGGQSGTPGWGVGNLSTEPPSAHEVSITVRDADGKAYSNLPVHTDILFGQSSFLSSGTFSAGRWFGCGPLYQGIPAFMTGASNPGLFYPEIYVPRNSLLFFDVERDDSAETVTQVAVDFPILLMGAKVIPQ